MRAILFDAGPVISLTLNNLSWLLEPLREKFGGSFCITNAVKGELVDRPLKTKKFEFEALQALRYIKKGIIQVTDSPAIDKKTLELLDMANNCFKAKDNFIRLVHYGEMSGIAACLLFGSNTFVVDERTTRLMIENPHTLKNILEHRLHTHVEVNADNLKKFRNITRNIKLIRSVELVTVAFEFGLMDDYIPDIPEGRKILLESLLWGVKLDGCAVSQREIEQIMRIELKK